MWSDNESSLDLLGFQHLVGAITAIVRDSTLLPATIGVYGDWGSGKSSLIQMAKAELEQDPDVLVVSFNGWLFDDYEAAKTALMGTILDELIARRTLTAKGKDLVIRLVKRVNLMRLAGAGGRAAIAYGVAGPAGLGLSAGADALGLAKELWEKADALKPEELAAFLKREEPGQSLRRGIREFRDDFAELLSDTKVKTLVVIIDDLDRCNPDTVIATLEAIKLFLFVPRTAFVIGADERLVKYAVRRRFPELPGERAEVGRDYLEKLVQFPVRVPPLGRAEMETYINLLFAKAGLPEERFEEARREAVNCPPELLHAVRFNSAIAERVLAKIPQDVIEGLALGQRIAPVLATGLLGNPRQCKRFLNSLVMRLAMAGSRKVVLNQRALAKLMLLEYFHPESFKALARAQAEQNGSPGDLAKAEAQAISALGEKSAGAGPQSHAAASEGDDFPAELPSWLSGPWLEDWLRSDPPLSGVDLRPYFFFARDTLGSIGSAVARMSPQAQEVLGQLLHESEAIRKTSLKKAGAVSPADAGGVFEALADRVRKEQDYSDSKTSPLARIVDWTKCRPELFAQLITLLGSLPEVSFPVWLVPAVTSAGEDISQQATLRPLLTRWVASTSNLSLAKAAQQRLAKLTS